MPAPPLKSEPAIALAKHPKRVVNAFGPARQVQRAMSSPSDFDTCIVPQNIQEKKKKKRSTKGKTKPTPILVADHGKNEGDDPRWAYEPPKGAVLLDHTVDAGAFEWDTIKDSEDTEIWLIRAPDSIKAKHLAKLEIDPPASSRTARVGDFTRKNTTYDVWSIGDEDADNAGGEELRALSCLLPRKRKMGKLYIAPKHVSQHIVISARRATATATEHQPVVYQNPPRPSYPKDVLKHSFIPYGARSEQSRSVDLSIEVGDNETDKPADTASSPKDKLAKAKEPKAKKRKVEGDSPKKSKKHKVNA